MEFQKETPLRHKKKAHLHLQKEEDILILKRHKIFKNGCIFLLIVATIHLACWNVFSKIFKNKKSNEIMNFFILKNNYFSQKLLNVRYKYGKHHIFHPWIATCLKTKAFFQIQMYKVLNVMLGRTYYDFYKFGLWCCSP
jgi:hypothetical protein